MQYSSIAHAARASRMRLREVTPHCIQLHCQLWLCHLFFGYTQVSVMENTNSLAKEFSEILIFEYFGYYEMLFFDAYSESSRMT